MRAVMARFEKRQLSAIHYLSHFAAHKNQAMRNESFLYRSTYLQAVKRGILDAGGKRMPKR
jgi:hypothetical protein